MAADNLAIGDMLDAAQYCEAMYALAARVFSREMDADTLEAIMSTAVAAEKDEAPGDQAADGSRTGDARAAGSVDPFESLLAPETRLLANLARYAGAKPDEVARLSRSEYAELFVGPRPPLAPYYESMYLGFPQRLFSEQTRAVRHAYEENGFTVVERNRVPDDQLGYELEFASNLCRAAVEAADDPERVAQLHATRMGFLKQHLAAWLPAFTERLEAASCADFYPAWARFARDLAAADLAAGE